MINTTHLHPMIVHFPVAIIIVGFGADILSLTFRNEKCLSRTGYYLMVLGAVAAVAAWTTGQFFTGHPDEGEIANVFRRHETGALLTMAFMVLGAGIRVYLVMKKKDETQVKWVVLAFYFLGFVAVAFTGYMGGRIVYDFMLT